jgi:hypothetical protein
VSSSPRAERVLVSVPPLVYEVLAAGARENGVTLTTFIEWRLAELAEFLRVQLDDQAGGTAQAGGGVTGYL